jgi:hypothetical protein
LGEIAVTFTTSSGPFSLEQSKRERKEERTTEKETRARENLEISALYNQKMLRSEKLSRKTKNILSQL